MQLLQGQVLLFLKISYLEAPKGKDQQKMLCFREVLCQSVTHKFEFIFRFADLFNFFSEESIKSNSFRFNLT